MWRPHKIRRIIPFYCTWFRWRKYYYVVEYIALESKCERVRNLHNVPLRPIPSITLVILFRLLLVWYFDFPTALWNSRCKGLHGPQPLGLTLRNLLSWFLLSLGFLPSFITDLVVSIRRTSAASFVKLRGWYSDILGVSCTGLTVLVVIASSALPEVLFSTFIGCLVSTSGSWVAVCWLNSCSSVSAYNSNSSFAAFNDFEDFGC